MTSMTKKLTVVILQIPESHKVYSIENPSQELVDLARDCHDQFVGMVDVDDEKVSAFLDDVVKAGNEVGILSPVEDAGMVVVSGFLM